MRTAVLIAAAALAVAGCDKIQNHLAAKADKPPPPPAAIQAAAPQAPAAAPAAELNAVPATAQAPYPTPPAPAPPAAAQPVRWSPADYAKRERRLQALIANAETRDSSGETQRRAEEGRYRRAHCATKACIESAYASEEAWLKQWEGSDDAK